MKCRKCQKKAVVYLKPYRLALCDECYPEFYTNLVKKSIKKFGILKNDENILVAVSGGKDSSAMASVLHELGYRIALFYIDLGIGEYSKRNEEVVRRLAEHLGVGLEIVRLRDYGFTIPELKRSGVKKACSACGTAKRYLMNRFARENGFDVVATGHTAEDIASFFLKNVAGGTRIFAEKLLPRNNPFDKRVVARAKPLFEMSEKENMLYVLLKQTPFSADDCPYAPSPDWKEIIYEIERRKPGFTKNFVIGLVREEQGFHEVRYCSECGEISSSEVCAFCRIRRRFGSGKSAVSPTSL
jgi:uncharacterized protein (TIGR00269 family)